jgi:hypothetical protein
VNNDLAEFHQKQGTWRTSSYHCRLVAGSGGSDLAQQHSESRFRYAISLHHCSRQIVRRPQECRTTLGFAPGGCDMSHLEQSGDAATCCCSFNWLLAYHELGRPVISSPTT